MYCRNCGKEIDDKAVICIHCGCAVMENQTPQMNPEYAQPKTGMGILLGLLLGLIGLIIGIAIYPEGTIARKTFMKSCLITIGISVLAYILLYVIYMFVIMSMFAMAC